MTNSTVETPAGANAVPGVVHHPSPLSVDGTVEGLTDVIAEMGAKTFAVVDHSGEAKEAGLALRETKLVIFGSPTAGTPLMQAAPVLALDLPMKVLVWADDVGAVWMTHLSGEWLTERYGLSADEARPLDTTAIVTSRIRLPQ